MVSYYYLKINNIKKIIKSQTDMLNIIITILPMHKYNNSKIKCFISETI